MKAKVKSVKRNPDKLHGWPRFAHVSGTKTKCSETCGKSEFLLINGSEWEYVCRSVLEDRIIDMVINCDYTSFCTGDPDEDTGIITIEVLG